MEENTILENSTELPKDGEKKMKNLLSLIILLSGLLIGSLFVDAGQLIKGSGYSQKNLNKSDIFTANGKTWVAYNEPAVALKVISDDSCEKCDPSEVLVWLRRVLPTVSAEKINFDSEEGKKLIADFSLKTLPAFIFAKNMEETELFSQAKELFELKDEQYSLDTQMLGLPAGKYLAFPQINENDATFGNVDAKAKVVIFSDFECPYCKVFYSALRSVMKDYQDKAFFAFKELPLEIHAQAGNASLAGECALEQNKFWEYADTLYAKQSEWSKAEGTANFKRYAAAIGIKTAQFNECLESKKYQSKIDEDKKTADEFGISGTPTIFAGEQVESGALTVEQLKKMIDDELNK